ncbi:hypothetical protein [Pedobacter xixiisoli]|uniref:hypothetical protein n=1 Tax=Pedobacter xixiisoli TaxID=1476464 RepID=UPI000BE488CF|nr:hypothetical protein [Pedobacter xixiisoli]
MKNTNLLKKAIISLFFLVFLLNGYAQVPNNSVSENRGNQILPISLISIALKSEEPNKITVNWSTSSEANNSHFDLYIAEKDSRNFVKIGRVIGSNNSSTLKEYQFIIHNVASINLAVMFPFLMFLLIPNVRNRFLRFAFFTTFAIVLISCSKKETTPSKVVKSYYVKLDQIDYDGKVTVFYSKPIIVEVPKK